MARQMGELSEHTVCKLRQRLHKGLKRGRWCDKVFAVGEEPEGVRWG
jgi:hypothetical protein